MKEKINEDMHIHLKDGIDNKEILNYYIKKCKILKLERVVFLDHGNRISSKHKAVLKDEISIDKFKKVLSEIDTSELSILSGIEIDYSTDMKFRTETLKLIEYGKFDWVVGSIHSMKFDEIKNYYSSIIDMINNYPINAIGHMILDDEYEKMLDKIIKICKLCCEKNIYIEINTSNRSRWNLEQLKFMLHVMKKYNVQYVFGSDAHTYEDIGLNIRETQEEIKKCLTN